MCPNTFSIPIAVADDVILTMIEGVVVGKDIIDRLLSLVENAPDETTYLTSTRGRLRKEIDNLVNSIALGIPAERIAPQVKEREIEIARVEAKLRLPRRERVDIAKLRAALEQRTEQWSRPSSRTQNRPVGRSRSD